MTITVEMVGTDELKAAFEKVASETPKVTAAAMVLEAEKVMAESVRQVPVDTGVLRASATVSAPIISGSNVSVELGYGGAASAYAMVQHERTDFNHPNGGKAKFLSDPLHNYASNGNLAASLGARIADWLNGSF